MTRSFEIVVFDERVLHWGLPEYQSEMAAAIDLYACVGEKVVLKAGNSATLVSSGIGIHIADPEIVGVVVPRSGLGHKSGVVLGNGTGIIDADYTGPIYVSLWNRNAPGMESVTISPGDRIAQLLFLPVIRPSFTVVRSFSAKTGRGIKGFGSTGA